MSWKILYKIQYNRFIIEFSNIYVRYSNENSLSSHCPFIPFVSFMLYASFSESALLHLSWLCLLKKHSLSLYSFCAFQIFTRLIREFWVNSFICTFNLLIVSIHFVLVHCIHEIFQFLRISPMFLLKYRL